MKIFTALALSVSLLMGAGTAQANLYKEGTTLHGYVESLSAFIPKTTEVVFVNFTDRTQFIQDLNPAVFEDNLPLQKMVEKAYGTAKEENREIYSNILLAKDFNGKQDVCTVFTPSMELVDGYYMHEIMHCIALSSAERYDMAKALAPVMKASFKASNGVELAASIKTNRVLEIHAHILADVIMDKTGMIADKASQESRNAVEYPRSVGKASSQRGMELCQTEGCSTDASELMNKLMGDEKFVEALKDDFATVSAFMSKTGNWR
jgi:hypothetical protein